MNEATILVVDDQPAVRRLLRSALQPWRVLEAADGETAWALLLAHRPSAAVVDIRMPGLSGVDLLRRIRATPALARTPVIVVTAHLSPAEMRTYVAAGADACLPKPFSVRRLHDAVAAALPEQPATPRPQSAGP